ncbi:MAG: hypothetical protein SVV03_02620 [Candidatus Nanohaloarchaea archaeon]|nr:hypothetical protein [Candidatus Nanohaloarchaea archaeon]
MIAVDHSEAVTKHYLAAENSLDEGYWDDAFRETEYFENDNSPAGPHPQDKGNCVGEFDVLLVNYDDQLAFYKEVKTSHGDMLYARKQIERAEEFFEDTDWDMIGSRVLED